jgi:NADH-quinone oxidoreductase subunit L
MSSSIAMIVLPVLSFLFLFLIGAKLSRFIVSLLGTGSIFLSAIYALYLLWQSFYYQSTKQVLWTFLPGGFLGQTAIDFTLYLDTLSVTMCVTITFVAAFIALYSSEYMASEEGLCRFFATINLFVAFMLVLVLADNLWLLFIGWEGVGICSYFLIGFYYREPRAVHAAMKAFITTRVGDIFLLFALFLCFILFETLEIRAITAHAIAHYPHGSALITITAFCFLGGAVGKSAQLPLHTWLADAMWGPTPVSALIHAATMVTAGVYLIARMSGLFLLSTDAQRAVMIIGLATLILAGFAALNQTDMKRVLAYSTMSQVGFMFLALGASAYNAAIFHLVTHAFFKSLLFLSAGVFGHAVHSYRLWDMGGLRQKKPVVFLLFLIGCANLVGLPFLSAGFFSKEWIMSQVLLLPSLGTWAFFIGVFGTFLTGLYTFRMIVIAFFGDQQERPDERIGICILLSLVVLAVFSFGIGWLETPHLAGNVHIISHFLAKSLPETSLDINNESVFWLFIPTIASLIGALLAIWLYGVLAIHRREVSIFSLSLQNLLKNGWGIDWFYTTVLINPYMAFSHRLRKDVVETLSERLVGYVNKVFFHINGLHTGNLTHYVSFVIVSGLVLAFVMVF